MVVLGRNAFIFESTGRTCNVQPFSSELGTATNVPIVDGAIAYECPYNHQVYILLIRNALYIPTMDTNLIPPFIMQAGVVIVNDTPKIHCAQPTTNDHCIQFTDSELKIPLQLNGIFSYFNSRLPSIIELRDCDKLFITPDASDWNPHCTSFASNENTMLNYAGELTSKHRRSNILMETENEADNIFEIAKVTSDHWEAHIDSNISSAYSTITETDTTSVSSSDTDNDFATALSLRGEISKFCASIGSCNISDKSEYPLFQDPSITTLDDLEAILDRVVEPSKMHEVKTVISAINAGKQKGPSPSELSKLWLISEKLAEGAFEQNIQLCCHNADNNLSRHFTTNDRIRK